MLATPATRRLARELGVDLATRARRPGRTAASPPTTSRGCNGGARRAAARGRDAPARATRRCRSHADGGDERIPLRGVRKKIAEKMARSVQTAAHFTYVEEST